MTYIGVYDTDDATITEVCDRNEISTAELVEMLLEYLDEVKEENDLK